MDPKKKETILKFQKRMLSHIVTDQSRQNESLLNREMKVAARRKYIESLRNFLATFFPNYFQLARLNDKSLIKIYCGAGLDLSLNDSIIHSYELLVLWHKKLKIEDKYSDVLAIDAAISLCRFQPVIRKLNLKTLKFKSNKPLYISKKGVLVLRLKTDIIKIFPKRITSKTKIQSKNLTAFFYKSTENEILIHYES